MSSKAENVDKKDVPQEETVAEHKLVDSQRSNTTNETDPFSLSGKPPKNNFVVFTEADNSKDSDSEATTISSTKDDSDSPVDHNLPNVPRFMTAPSTEDIDDSNPNEAQRTRSLCRSWDQSWHDWSHDLVLCASPEAVSLPLSLEGRVMGLEQKLHELQEQTKLVQGGLGKLEGQLARLEQFLQTGVVTE
ncbi:hypothetical protein GALMADRAFT_145026 [Galerina marginata CBS 339.88]|uniref:Uncharacterized protein n=1 Tax=Galerina marginata (strain CBS 339.88) TaxID=685588 RepID=A0A067SJ18_GALM3|nr:hypothetical protein GALMADRAFT_145026 [Galerina marginata CBS 339.88]